MLAAIDKYGEAGAAARGAPAAATVIVGLGRTGLACVRHLAALRAHCVVLDTRAEPPGLAALRAELPELEVHLGPLDAGRLCSAGRIVLSPGVALAEPAVAAARAAGVPVLGDIELFARAARAPVLAVTGSNGKSTVTTLLGAMARRAGRRVRVGGNLGPPALDLLGEPAPEFYILELSSFQLETTASLEPLVATVLNISVDHMDRYATAQDYRRAKARIFHGHGIQVLNRDDPVVAALHRPGRTTIGFGLGVPHAGDFGLRQRNGRAWLARGRRVLLPAAELRIAGRHNIANALAALALGAAAGFDEQAMGAALRDFEGLAHRCRLVAERDGVRWYNDSKGTNLGATLAAIEGIGEDSPVVLIAGGEGKGADFRPLAEALRRHGRGLVLIGRDAPLIETAVGGATPVVRARNLGEAVAQARVLARCGDSVVLSPACASFDMFANFEQRGERFEAAVRAELGA